MTDVIKSCESCGNIVPPDVRFGARCPHCGVKWNQRKGEIEPHPYLTRDDGPVTCPSCERGFSEFTNAYGCPHCQRTPEFGPNVVQCLNCYQTHPVSEWIQNGNICLSRKCIRRRELGPKRKELLRVVFLGAHGAVLATLGLVFYLMGYSDRAFKNSDPTGLELTAAGVLGFLVGAAIAITVNRQARRDKARS